MEKLIFLDGDGCERIDLGDNLSIKRQDFLDRFGTIFEYSVLAEHENTTEGWEKIFDRWKEQGILN